MKNESGDGLSCFFLLTTYNREENNFISPWYLWNIHELIFHLHEFWNIVKILIWIDLM